MASLIWFARHELRLAWRDTAVLLQGGRTSRRKPRRSWGAVLALGIFVGILHLIAYAVLGFLTDRLQHPDKAAFVTITGSAFLTWVLLFSQAMETVTRSFYTRADLDLILSSPMPAARVFAVRILANTLTTIALAALLIGPIIDMAAFVAGPRFLWAYAVVVAMSCSASGLAVGTVALLFRVAGPKRTRLVAQIAAAVIGAGFVIWVQIIAILSYGRLSRVLMFQSPQWIAAAPAITSPIWWPARAAFGEGGAGLCVAAGGLGTLLAAIWASAPAFAQHATTVAGLPTARVLARPKAVRFARRSQGVTLWAKEWTLLWRDPWLVSQSLMQILYLVPPALLLWRDFGTNTDSLMVLVPVLVMAAGQLAGGLAWLAISGEDVPDLVASAPITSAAVLRAKTWAVMTTVALPIVPVVAIMACTAPRLAVLTLVGSGCAAAGSSAVQYFFRSQAQRSMFRRRQTSSRFATFAEALLSIAIAAAAGLAAAGALAFAAGAMVLAVLILAGSRLAAGQPRGI